VDVYDAVVTNNCSAPMMGWAVCDEQKKVLKGRDLAIIEKNPGNCLEGLTENTKNLSPLVTEPRSSQTQFQISATTLTCSATTQSTQTSHAVLSVLFIFYVQRENKHGVQFDNEQRNILHGVFNYKYKA